jgi:hypothetical protein
VKAWVIASAALALPAIPAGARAQPCDPGEDAARISAHLANVVRALEQRDVSELDADQRGARRAGLDALRAYVADGVYPRNTTYPGHLVPTFVDDGGRDCAVGRILIASGGAEIAERVRARQNHAYLADMQVDGLAEWVARSGFTFEELAWIQPDYCGEDEPCRGWSYAPGSPPGETPQCELVPFPDGTLCGGANELTAICNEHGTCVDGTCFTKPPRVACPESDDACTTNRCDPDAMACVSSPTDCDDGRPETIDGCDPDAGCTHRDPSDETTGGDGRSSCAFTGRSVTSWGGLGGVAAVVAIVLTRLRRARPSPKRRETRSGGAAPSDLPASKRSAQSRL